VLIDGVDDVVLFGWVMWKCWLLVCEVVFWFLDCL